MRDEGELYLSRLVLDGRSRAVRRDLGDCRELHRTLLSAFGEAPTGVEGAREHFGVLYRVEDGGGAAVCVLVQSRAKPDWGRVPEGYLENAACRRVDDAYARLAPGALLRFRLRANPTKRVSAHDPLEPERWHGKRVDLRGEEARLGWLRRKGEVAGFALVEASADGGIPDVRADPGAGVTGRRDGRRLTFGSVLFEGRLRVVDAGRFRRALVEGLGSGKAYGFGLLSVAPGEVGREGREDG